MMYDTDYAIYQYINAQVEQYVEFDDLLKQNHCTMEEAQQEIKAFREKYHSLLAGYAFSDCDLAAACEELMAQMEQHPGSLDLQYLYLCIVTDFCSGTQGCRSAPQSRKSETISVSGNGCRN